MVPLITPEFESMNKPAGSPLPVYVSGPLSASLADTATSRPGDVGLSGVQILDGTLVRWRRMHFGSLRLCCKRSACKPDSRSCLLRVLHRDKALHISLLRHPKESRALIDRNRARKG